MRFFSLYIYKKIQRHMIKCKVIFSFIVASLCIVSIQLQAQSDIDFENHINHPEVDLIISFSQTTINHEIQFTGTDAIDVIINEMRNEEETDDDVIEELEDLLDALGDLDDPPSEPEKEELVLVKEYAELESKIYPNPASNYIKLAFDETNNYLVEIYDLIGNKVLSDSRTVDLGTELKFNLNNFQEGVYIMHIKSDSAMTIKKFAIKHNQ